MTARKIKRSAASVLFTIVIMTTLIGAPVPNAAAQTRPLQSAVCVDSIGVPTHYRFTQGAVPYWSVVGVTPEYGDDKDIYLYSGPTGTGTLLAYSNAIAGADYIVCDFNHTPYGTYYPTALYGGNGLEYTVEWKAGGKILPLNQEISFQMCGYGSDCNALDVWDVYLEAGTTYRFYILSAQQSVRITLFRNPGTGAYYAGRGQSVMQLEGVETNVDFTAPATDWYGVVMSSEYNQPQPFWASFEVRKLNTCQPLASGTCQSAVLYNTVTGPADSWYSQQPVPWWSAAAAAPSPGDRKKLYLRSVCDYTADVPAILAYSAPGVDKTALVVADFSHVSVPTTVYPSIDDGSYSAPYTIEWEDGEDFFVVNSVESGTVGGTTGNCSLVKMWDILLNSGSTYRVSYGETGTADIHVAFFGHPDNAPYYASLTQALWHLTDPVSWSGYTADHVDDYGLAVFANKREASGSYWLSFEALNDCVFIPTGLCGYFQGNLKDFSVGATENNYWLAVGVLPSDGDDKDISVYTACDGGGSLLGYSNGTQGMDFVVADCNHPPSSSLTEGSDATLEPLANTWYPRVTYGSPSNDYMVSCDLGNSISEDLFPHDVVVPGTVDPSLGNCGVLKIWDVYLQSGLAYTFAFTRAGGADVRVALFRNSTNTRVYKGRAAAEFQIGDSQNYDYTAPATDYYGLAVFANKRGQTGSYTLRVSRASGVTGIDPEPFIPNAYALYQNAPNPFNPTTEIRYDVPSSGGHVELRVYDVHGRLVRTLVDSYAEGGAKSVTWDARDDGGSPVATGVYFYRLDAPGFSETRKMAVMK